MKIVEAQKEDINQIILIALQISKIHYENRPNTFKQKDYKIKEKYILKIMNGTEEKILVAKDEKNKIYGILIYKIKEIYNNDNLKDTTIFWINDLGVDKDSRQKGIGTLLINKAKQIAKQLKCKSIELNCWEFNENAMKFYIKQNMKTQRRIMEIEI